MGPVAMLPFTSMQRCTVFQWLQRNAALQYIEERKLDGVVVSTDDRHSHTPEVFHTLFKQYCSATAIGTTISTSRTDKVVLLLLFSITVWFWKHIEESLSAACHDIPCGALFDSIL